MFERTFPYPDNIMPRLIYRKSISETPLMLKRKMEQMRTHYRSKVNELPWKLILQLSY